MNETFNLPVNDTPTNQGMERIYQFETVMHEELCELKAARQSNGLDRLVNIADLLGDLLVYIRSEARRWGIPLEDVYNIIMDSQESKLVDGKPVMAPDGSKFIKGPHYVPPEPRIRELLHNLIMSQYQNVTRSEID